MRVSARVAWRGGGGLGPPGRPRLFPGVRFLKFMASGGRTRQVDRKQQPRAGGRVLTPPSAARIRARGRWRWDSVALSRRPGSGAIFSRAIKSPHHGKPSPCPLSATSRLMPLRRAGRAHWIRPKSVRTACSLRTPKDDQHDDADQRNEADQPPPAASVSVVQPAYPHRERR